MLRGHTSAVRCVCVGEVADGVRGAERGRTLRRLVPGSMENTLRVWDVMRGKCVSVLERHTANISCVCVVSDRCGRRWGNGGNGAAGCVWVGRQRAAGVGRGEREVFGHFD